MCVEFVDLCPGRFSFDTVGSSQGPGLLEVLGVAFEGSIEAKHIEQSKRIQVCRVFLAMLMYSNSIYSKCFGEPE